MYDSSCDGDRFVKNFCFGTFCNITQEPQELQRFTCASGFIGKSAEKKHYQWLSKCVSINKKLCFNQLATASFSTPS